MKFLFVTTISSTINEFLCPHAIMLLSQGHRVDFAARMVEPIDPELTASGCQAFDIPFCRAIVDRRLIDAWSALRRLLHREQYDVVHTHTPVASALVRWACRDLHGTRVMYTAHGFHFYAGAPLLNWVLYFPIEWVLARYTDIIITINSEDFERAKRRLPAARVRYVPGVGLDTGKFGQPSLPNPDLRSELGLPLEAFVLLSVGELNANKDHATVIRSLAEIPDENVHYLICGTGDGCDRLWDLSRSLGIAHRVHLPGRRNNIAAIYRLADLFILPSHREGLSVALMEAMATGLPVVCSAIRGNTDLIQAGGGALVRRGDVPGFTQAIRCRIDDRALCRREGAFNREAIKDFDRDRVLAAMAKLYQGVTDE